MAERFSATSGKHMSRVGKKPILIPNNVKVEANDRLVAVNGSKGNLSYSLPPGIKIELKNNEAVLTRQDDSKNQKSLHGLARSLVSNMIKGVSEGYSKELEIVGVGFRAAVMGKKLSMQLGKTHPVEHPIPEGITIETPKPNQIIVKGIDKAKVGEVAAKIRAAFKPEPYKGKGIKYVGEYIRRKAGKTVT